MTPAQIDEIVRSHGLFVMGHDRTRILIGTAPGFWDVFTESAEFSDGNSDPIDRWSKRILGELAADLGAVAQFPSDGPPYAPFIAWALATGRFWQSPTGMLVHDVAGLMISIRGALQFEEGMRDVPWGASPCETCAQKPCITACPVDALSADRPYDVPACKAYLDTPAGMECMTRGCHVRRACPVSQSFGRIDAQSAFHMKAFHG
jgi:epoxyqueuosine reductase